MKFFRHFGFCVFLATILFSCGSGETPDETDSDSTAMPDRLPYIGFHDVQYIEKNGQMVADTIYHTVPDFALTAQDSSLVTGDFVKGKIYVANFFFTHCPAICPAMIEQMKRLQQNTLDIPEILFLSHTVDPERDTLGRLQAYIAERNLDTRNWFFLWGPKEDIYALGQEGYVVNAMEDEHADGGFFHDEHFALIDREGHVRGLYDGTKPAEVDKLESAIRKLLRDEYGQ